MLKLNSDLEKTFLLLATAIQKAGGQAVAVGGCVRDALMGKQSKEVDVEVFGLMPEALEAVLKDNRLGYDLVGQAFGVLKLKGIPIDVSIPRKETKLGLGHQGFAIESDPFLTYQTAAARRDFTCNAMAWDPLEKTLLDPYGGERDMKEGVLRHVGSQFSEDPLRVLRAMQFLARFEWKIAPETLAVCQKMTPENLPAERLFGEWKKLLLLGKRPSLGLNFLLQSGWIQYYPEIAALIDCPQDPEWHPEGDAWVHTLHAMDAFATERLGDEWEDLIVGLAVLCHDLGKPLTTTRDEHTGRIRSLGHETAGEEPTRSFLNRITGHKNLIEAVVVLVITHMRPQALYKDNASDAAIRRLALKVERIDRLVRVCKADHSGRPPLPIDDFPEGAWLLKRAHELEVASEAPKPILLGRHLIERGMKPGVSFKKILNRAYEAQIEGRFGDFAGALKWLDAELLG
jgi:tRNA nucleotidyltransferase (CCA-adding enzyme)